MGVLDSITPQQRKLLMFGVPAVAVLALGMRLGRSSSSSSSADTADESAGRPSALLAPITSGGATDVLGVGQLADFESVVTGTLGGLTTAVKELQNREPAAPCVAPIYPAFKSGPVDCKCPPGTTLIDDRAGNRYSCAAPNDAADFDRLVKYVRENGRAPF